MSTVARIQAILDCAVRVPLKDRAGVITPAGVDASVEVRVLERCLKIAREELNRSEQGTNPGVQGD